MAGGDLYQVNMTVSQQTNPVIDWKEIKRLKKLGKRFLPAAHQYTLCHNIDFSIGNAGRDLL